MFTTGFVIAVIGITLCVLLCALGSAIGLYKTSSAAAGVAGEDPKKFNGTMIMLMLLPATQGLYGFVIAIMASNQLAGLYAAEMATTAHGWAIFGACLPMALTGFLSASFQGRAAVNGIYAAGKQSSVGFKIVMGPAMIELYSLLGLVISIMVLMAL